MMYLLILHGLGLYGIGGIEGGAAAGGDDVMRAAVESMLVVVVMAVHHGGDLILFEDVAPESTAPGRFCHTARLDAVPGGMEEDKDEVVVLLKVLASDISRGDNNFGMWAIDTINGKPFKNFKEFYGMMEKSALTGPLLTVKTPCCL